MARLLPWPLKHQRAAAIQAARAQKEASRRGAAHAAAIGADIERMTADNHFAAAIRASLLEGRGKGRGAQ